MEVVVLLLCLIISCFIRLWRFRDRSFLRFDTVAAYKDGQTDGRADMTMANATLCLDIRRRLAVNCDWSNEYKWLEVAMSRDKTWHRYKSTPKVTEWKWTRL